MASKVLEGALRDKAIRSLGVCVFGVYIARARVERGCIGYAYREGDHENTHHGEMPIGIYKLA